MAAIKVRSALACEDIRQEASGKLIAIGILNPVLGRPRVDLDRKAAPLSRFHFLLSIDVPEAGDIDVQFRLRPLNGRGTATIKMGVQFVRAAKDVPFSLGPMRLRVEPDETGFVLEQSDTGDRWKRVGEWRFEDADDEEQD